MVLTGSAVKLFLDKFKVSKFTQVSVKKKTHGQNSEQVSEFKQ